jgi:DNA-entry nuclease
MKKLIRFIWPVFLLGCFLLGACSIEITSPVPSAPQTEDVITLDNIPEYNGDAYVVLEDNNPSFQKEDMTTASFERYRELDELGRCGTAYANVGVDLMPTKERGSIGQVKPSGWQTVKYDNVDGKYLYNRCHLIGYQLTAENANEKNLITGTRYLNIEGMLPFENMIADYVKETKNHVLYRVTPIFEGENLVASGVQMEGYSVEDEGEGICFSIYAYNVQPGIIIDYVNGKSERSNAQQKESSTEQAQVEIRGNSNSMIYHCPGQAAYEEMENSKYLILFHSEQEAKDAGYRKAKR